MVSATVLFVELSFLSQLSFLAYRTALKKSRNFLEDDTSIAYDFYSLEVLQGAFDSTILALFAARKMRSTFPEHLKKKAKYWFRTLP